ncbi:hypothetical protein JI739_12695 [Ramlibacter sp. AW1]|uniref:Polysaccharide biosynthesis protein n=1 Tax=Ramlibacter aurantiacus TaxID=2801330 RepID=A0A936ZGW4_9BURK|nr:hypothetical protein [Ramlibacter aurantiacus]MBL0421209.1 hypothetical protein [Ramlibacter aurantiacus]
MRTSGHSQLDKPLSLAADAAPAPSPGWRSVLGKAIAANGILLLAGVLYTSVLALAWGSASAGALIFHFAAYASAPLLLTGADQLALRFGSGQSTASDARLFTGLLVVKLLVGLLIVLAVGVALSRYEAAGNGPWPFQLSLMVHAGLAPLANAWAARVLLIHGRHRDQLAVELGYLLLCSLWTWVASRTLARDPLTGLAAGLAAISVASLAVRLALLARRQPRLARRMRQQLRQPLHCLGAIATPTHWHYFWPMSFTAVSGFIKDAFPVIAVGVGATTGVLAEFRLLQQAFRSAAGLIPEAMEWARPSFRRALRTDPALFARGYRRWARSCLVLTMLAALGLCAVASAMLPLLGLSFGNGIFWCAAILGVDLIAASALQIEYQVYVLRERIAALAGLSALRQVLTIATSWLLVDSFGPAGVAAGLAIGTVCAWAGFMWLAWRQQLRAPADLLESALLLLAASGLLITAAWWTSPWIR